MKIVEAVAEINIKQRRSEESHPTVLPYMLHKAREEMSERS